MAQEIQEDSGGWLAIVATPIGNLEDITLRALRTLQEADTICAEDTRRTRILLDKYDIRKKLESYHIFNEHGRTPDLIDRIRKGEKLVLVSDAGTPCIADPGFYLIRAAAEAGIEPRIIPGVSALTFAISGSALPSDRFAFYGFLPVKSGRRGAALARIAAEDKTCVIFESPFRLEKLIREIAEVIGSETRIAIVREATKVHEQILRGTAAELLAKTAGTKWKGECVVVLHASHDDESADAEDEQ